jgi:hypothetical protein
MIDGIVKNLDIVMPDLIRHPERVEFKGFRPFGWLTVLSLSKDFRWHDGKENFSIYYEFIMIIFPKRLTVHQ